MSVGEIQPGKGFQETPKKTWVREGTHLYKWIDRQTRYMVAKPKFGSFAQTEETNHVFLEKIALKLEEASPEAIKKLLKGQPIEVTIEGEKTYVISPDKKDKAFHVFTKVTKETPNSRVRIDVPYFFSKYELTAGKPVATLEDFTSALETICQNDKMRSEFETGYRELEFGKKDKIEVSGYTFTRKSERPLMPTKAPRPVPPPRGAPPLPPLPPL